MNLFEYYKNNPSLTTWSIIILLACLAVGVAAVYLHRWLKNKQPEKPLEEEAQQQDTKPIEEQTTEQPEEQAQEQATEQPEEQEQG